MDKITLGFIPTRRNLFTIEEARHYAALTKEKLKELNIDFVDIDALTSDGLLHEQDDSEKIADYFKTHPVDGLFFPHANFGTEFEVARLAKKMKLPVLLWGPRDEAPNEAGIRTRDSQCGLFATGKVLRRFDVPFTYLPNCSLQDKAFLRGLDTFIRVCNIVKVFRQTRILQLGTRPFGFWSVIANEGELIEKFNIQLAPVPLPELFTRVEEMKKNTEEISRLKKEVRQDFCIHLNEEQLETSLALKLAIRSLAEEYHCNAAAMQCWNALPEHLKIMPCFAHALLNEEGFPVACETDIHGAITSLLVEAADLGRTRSFFADWTICHRENDNGELLQHCGPWPKSTLRTEKPSVDYPLAFSYSGSVQGEAKPGLLSLARFDGDHGNYSLLLGNAKTIAGPKTKGTYVWVEVKNLPKLEAKLVEGPYIHHCVGIHENVVPSLYEACKYIGIKPDLYDDNDEEIKAYLRGE